MKVSAIKDKMDEKGNEIFCSCRFFLAEITKTPTYFSKSTLIVSETVTLVYYCTIRSTGSHLSN